MPFGLITKLKGDVMNLTEILGLLHEITTAYNELKADGTIDKLIEAEQTVKSHMEHNENLKKMIDHLGKFIGAQVHNQQAHAAQQPPPHEG